MIDPWYVIQVRPNAEKRVLEGLRELKVEAYVPIEKVWRHAGRPRKIVHERPLIRGYVFAILSDRDHAALHEVDGFHRLVGFNGKPATFPAKELDQIRADEASGEYDKTKPIERKVYAKGQKVRISKGPYAGRIGVISRLSGQRRIQVMLDIAKANTTMDDVEEVKAEEPEPALKAA